MLIIAYRASSKPFQKLGDYLHKALSPSTYRCKLCQLSHGNFGPYQEWKQFLKQSGQETRFVYEAAFKKDFGHLGFQLPCILLTAKNETELILSAEEIENSQSLEEMISKAQKNLEKFMLA